MSNPMVTHAELPDRSRRSSSVASRSRRGSHHRSQSQYGGTQYAPQNDFPIFSIQGDVEVLVSFNGQEKRYLLHHSHLAHGSGFFQEEFREDWPSSREAANHINSPEARRARGSSDDDSTTTLSAPGRSPPQAERSQSTRRRWRFELETSDMRVGEAPMLVQRPPQGSLFVSSIPPPRVQSRPPPAIHNLLNRAMGIHRRASQSTANLPGPPPAQAQVHVQSQPARAALHPLLRDYDNLFRLFYHMEPDLDAENITSAYDDCFHLLMLADMYDALPLAGRIVEHHLLRFSSRLFKQIARDPPSYLKLGYLAQSKIIFSEALTHIIGQWPTHRSAVQGTAYSRCVGDVPHQVRDLIDDKIDELDDLKRDVDIKLQTLTLANSRGERATSSNDRLGWIALSHWRNWLADNLAAADLPPQRRGILRTSPSSGPGRTNSRSSGRDRSRPGQGQTQTQTPVTSTPTQTTIPRPNSGHMYRAIALNSDHQGFLPRNDYERLLRSISSSLATPDRLRRFDQKMDEIKARARAIVQPLLRNCLEVEVSSLSDGQGGSLGYLTCMRVERGEFPWKEREVLAITY